MGLIYFLIVGAISGWLAGLLRNGSGFGLLGNIVVGIVGAFLGSWLFGIFDVSFGGGMLDNIITSVVGALVLLFLLTGLLNNWVNPEQLKEKSNRGKTQLVSTKVEILEPAPLRSLIHTPYRDSEDTPQGLKELTDKKSHALLLETPTSISLSEFKSIAKLKIPDGIEIAIVYLRENLHSNSILFDDLILLQGQWNRLKQDERNGTISHHDIQLGNNNISKRISSLIVDIQEQDLKE